MYIILNNEKIQLSSDDMNITEILESRHIPLNGTAVAINDRLVVRSKWENTIPDEGDRITLISAAFGG